MREVFKYTKYFQADEKNIKGENAYEDMDRFCGLTLVLLNEMRADSGVPIKIHAFVETDGHAPDTEHKRTAVDFHFEGLTLAQGYKIIKQVLEKYNLLDKVGLGAYFWWDVKGFHFDLRGYKTRWISNTKGVYNYDYENFEFMLK
jgi:hypothetical protein